MFSLYNSRNNLQHDIDLSRNTLHYQLRIPVFNTNSTNFSHEHDSIKIFFNDVIKNVFESISFLEISSSFFGYNTQKVRPDFSDPICRNTIKYHSALSCLSTVLHLLFDNAFLQASSYINYFHNPTEKYTPVLPTLISNNDFYDSLYKLVNVIDHKNTQHKSISVKDLSKFILPENIIPSYSTDAKNIYQKLNNYRFLFAYLGLNRSAQQPSSLSFESIPFLERLYNSVHFTKQNRDFSDLTCLSTNSFQEIYGMQISDLKKLKSVKNATLQDIERLLLFEETEQYFHLMLYATKLYPFWNSNPNFSNMPVLFEATSLPNILSRGLYMDYAFFCKENYTNLSYMNHVFYSSAFPAHFIFTSKANTTSQKNIWLNNMHLFINVFSKIVIPICEHYSFISLYEAVQKSSTKTDTLSILIYMFSILTKYISTNFSEIVRPIQIPSSNNLRCNNRLFKNYLKHISGDIATCQKMDPLTCNSFIPSTSSEEYIKDFYNGIRKQYFQFFLNDIANSIP